MALIFKYLSLGDSQSSLKDDSSLPTWNNRIIIIPNLLLQLPECRVSLDHPKTLTSIYSCQHLHSHYVCRVNEPFVVIL